MAQDEDDLLAIPLDNPNGIALAPDGQTLYVAAEAERRILAYDVRDDGTLANERQFAEAGNPDGLAIDRLGNLYAAEATTLTVGAWNSQGERLFSIDVPEQPSNVAFADDGNTLYVTATSSLYRVKLNVVPSGPTLQAGDADQDLDFDQLDLVQVQVAAKYLTGQPATWGEGDWNGAPGGSPGSPPQGDGLFNQLDIVAAQQASRYLAGPYAAQRLAGQRGDGQASIVDNANTGEVALDAPAGTKLTPINVDSAAGIFTGTPAQSLDGSFDNADTNVFKATFGSSFGSIGSGDVAQPGLSQELLLSDLTVVGSLAGGVALGGTLGDVDLIYVPEPGPATLLLAAAGIVCLTVLAGRCPSRNWTR